MSSVIYRDGKKVARVYTDRDFVRASLDLVGVARAILRNTPQSYIEVKLADGRKAEMEHDVIEGTALLEMFPLGEVEGPPEPEDPDDEGAGDE